MAAKHLVVCVQCGRQFDANRGGYYNSQTRRYTCKSCGRRTPSPSAPARPSVPQPVTAKSLKSPMIGKILIAAAILLFGIFALFAGGWPLTVLCLGGAVAVALWGILPYVKRKKLEEQMRAEILRAKAEKLNRPKVCARCGATTKGAVCEFCGFALPEE